MRDILIFAGGVVLGATVAVMCGEETVRQLGLDDYLLDTDDHREDDDPNEEGILDKLFG